MKLIVLFFTLLVLASCGEPTHFIEKDKFEPGVISPQSVEAKNLVKNNWCAFEDKVKNGAKVKTVLMNIFQDMEGNARSVYFENDKIIKSFKYKYKLDYPTLTWGSLQNPNVKQIELLEDQLIIKLSLIHISEPTRPY